MVPAGLAGPRRSVGEGIEPTQRAESVPEDGSFDAVAGCDVVGEPGSAEPGSPPGALAAVVRR